MPAAAPLPAGGDIARAAQEREGTGLLWGWTCCALSTLTLCLWWCGVCIEEVEARGWIQLSRLWSEKPTQFIENFATFTVLKISNGRMFTRIEAYGICSFVSISRAAIAEENHPPNFSSHLYRSALLSRTHHRRIRAWRKYWKHICVGTASGQLWHTLPREKVIICSGVAETENLESSHLSILRRHRRKRVKQEQSCFADGRQFLHDQVAEVLFCIECCLIKWNHQ